MRDTIATVTACIAITLGGSAYLFLFWSHPYMGGFPDVAVHAQSAAQTLAKHRVTAEPNTADGPFATQYFPILPLLGAAASAVAGVHPIVAFWMLQLLLPFLAYALAFLIGRALLRSTLGGLVAAASMGLVANLPFTTDQSFSWLLSTYAISALFTLAAIAFLPLALALSSRASTVAPIAMLGIAAFLAHHHLGPIRFLMLTLGIAAVGAARRWLPSVDPHRHAGVMLVTFIGFLVLFAVTHVGALPQFIAIYLPQVLGPRTGGGGMGAPPVSLDAAFTVLTHPLVVGVVIMGAVGGLLIGFTAVRRWLRWSGAQTVLTAMLLASLPIALTLYALGLALPNRYLHEVVMGLLPFAGITLLLPLIGLPPAVRMIPIALLWVAGSASWFTSALTIERSLNTSWENVRFLTWAARALPRNAIVLTDPFTFHILLTSTPYVRDATRRRLPSPSAGAPTVAAARAHILSWEEDKLAAAIRRICPEYVVLDPPQTSQFHNLRPPAAYLRRPELLTVAFDSGGVSERRIIALATSSSVCPGRGELSVPSVVR